MRSILFWTGQHHVEHIHAFWTACLFIDSLRFTRESNFPYDLHKYAIETMCFASRLANQTNEKKNTRTHTHRHSTQNEQIWRNSKKVAGVVIYPIKYSVRLNRHGPYTERERDAYFCAHVCWLWSVRASNMTCAYFEDGILNLCEVNL